MTRTRAVIARGGSRFDWEGSRYGRKGITLAGERIDLVGEEVVLIVEVALVGEKCASGEEKKSL